jgi:putative sugar O-methyltransferase
MKYQPLPRWDKPRFEITADVDLLAQLTRDLEACGGALKPAPGWLLPEHLVHGSMNQLLDPWNGEAGLVPLRDALEATSGRTSTKMAKYAGKFLVPYFDRYVRSIDHIGLLNGVTLYDLAEANWRIFDMESLMDFLQLSAFFDFNDDHQVVLEIGGGFGRLIEFIALLTGKHFQYINIDAVPVSMMYCHLYLKERFPDRSVRIFNGDDSTNNTDFLIVPAWHLDRFHPPPVDLGINIESMQEMSQGLVDFYIGYLDRSVREDGIVFLINSREHEFIGDWSFPNTWQCLFRHRTARSWSINHATEFFRKTSRNQKPQNLLRTEAYWQETRYAEFVQELQFLNNQRFNPHGIPNMLTAKSEQRKP